MTTPRTTARPLRDLGLEVGLLAAPLAVPILLALHAWLAW